VDADDTRDDMRTTGLPRGNQPTEQTIRNRALSQPAYAGART
jgi:hypothetical protein